MIPVDGSSKYGTQFLFGKQVWNEDKNGVVMELAAIKDLAHWNYKPEAQYIWNFFEKYSRDTKTGKLIFHK
jgi:hypothetical protein